MPKKWIQKALRKHQEGSLHRQLGVPSEKKIPSTLLTKVVNTEIGKKVKNPSKTGKRSVKVTTLLKKRSVLAKNLREMKR